MWCSQQSHHRCVARDSSATRSFLDPRQRHLQLSLEEQVLAVSLTRTAVKEALSDAEDSLTTNIAIPFLGGSGQSLITVGDDVKRTRTEGVMDITSSIRVHDTIIRQARVDCPMMTTVYPRSAIVLTSLNCPPSMHSYCRLRCLQSRTNDPLSFTGYSFLHLLVVAAQGWDHLRAPSPVAKRVSPLYASALSFARPHQEPNRSIHESWMGYKRAIGSVSRPDCLLQPDLSVGLNPRVVDRGVGEDFRSRTFAEAEMVQDAAEPNFSHPWVALNPRLMDGGGMARGGIDSADHLTTSAAEETHFHPSLPFHLSPYIDLSPFP